MIRVAASTLSAAVVSASVVLIPIVPVRAVLVSVFLGGVLISVVLIIAVLKRGCDRITTGKGGITVHGSGGDISSAKAAAVDQAVDKIGVELHRPRHSEEQLYRPMKQKDGSRSVCTRRSHSSRRERGAVMDSFPYTRPPAHDHSHTYRLICH